MGYLIIIALQFIGILLHIIQKAKEISDDIPDEEETFSKVFSKLIIQDGLTIAGSIVVLCLNLLVHFIIQEYEQELTETRFYYLFAFGTALILGYAGQRLIYGWLGKGADYLNKKVNDKLQG